MSLQSAILVGMAVQATIVAALMQFGVIRVTPLQQLATSGLFLVLALLVN